MEENWKKILIHFLMPNVNRLDLRKNRPFTEPFSKPNQEGYPQNNCRQSKRESLWVQNMPKQKMMLLLGTIFILLIAVAFISSTWNTNDTAPTPNESTPSTSPMATTASPTVEPTTPNPTSTPNNTSTPTNEDTPGNSTSNINTPTATTTPTPAPTTTPNPTTTSNAGTPTNTPTNPVINVNYASYIITSNASSTNVAQTLANNKDDHDKAQDYTWNSSDAVTVKLNTNAISVDKANGTTIAGTTLTITAAGTYIISGTLNNGQIIVNTPDTAVVRLILNGATINSTTIKAPIYIANAKKTIIILANNTQNYITDTQSNLENATIYSKDDLTIYGDGALTVKANANDGIRSNDGLVIKGGQIIVNSVDDGICGKDYIVIKGGSITVNAVGDGLKSDNDVETDRGYILIENGTLTIVSTKGDAISAQTDLLITNGNLTLTSGGGSNVLPNEAISTRGLKAAVNVVIDNGNFIIRSSDDAIHSNDTIVINNGTYDLATGDDAIHADMALEINGGTFNISKSFEGLESAAITINNGYIQIKSSDDGINGAGGNDGSSTDWRPGQRPPGQIGFAPTGNYHLTITGGFIYIEAVGDGLDINGYIEMSGGFVIINGPVVNFNGAIDYDGSFKLTGGTLIAVGSSGMAQAPSTTSTQHSVLVKFNAVQSANKLISIQTALGEELLTVSPTKAYQSIVFSSPKLTVGSYDLYLGGTSTGTASYGVYYGGVYSGGSKYTSFTVSDIVTNIR